MLQQAVDFTTADDVHAVMSGKAIKGASEPQKLVKSGKNKAKTMVTAVRVEKVAAPVAEVEKKRPGRPKGSKNKPKGTPKVKAVKGPKKVAVAVRTPVKAWSNIPKATQKLILDASQAEENSAVEKERFRDLLVEIRNALSCDSFVHPDRGELTIMTRRDRSFWRSKPAWTDEARAKNQAKRQAAE